MAIKRHVRRYPTPDIERLEEMMNGTHSSSQYNKEWQMGPHERVTAVVTKDGYWVVFSDELVMGPPCQSPQP